MKKLGIVLAGTVLLAACNGTNSNSGGDVTLNTADQKASYALGFRSAEQMQTMDGLDVDALVAGLRDGFKDKPKSRLGDEDLNKLIQDYQVRMMQKRQAKLEKEAADNEKKAEDFLADNAKKDGVKTTKSGLEYQVLESASKDGAASPTLDDTVKVHYVGKLIDGTEFDSSVKRGKPAVFGLKHIIPGWQEVLPMMKVGDKWRVWIPPKLGYGEQGAGEQIGPNEVLVFDIQLLGINEPADDAPAAADQSGGDAAGKAK